MLMSVNVIASVVCACVHNGQNARMVLNPIGWLCSSQRACEHSEDAAQAEVGLHEMPHDAAHEWGNRAAVTGRRRAGRGRSAPAAMPSTNALNGHVGGLSVGGQPTTPKDTHPPSP